MKDNFIQSLLRSSVKTAASLYYKAVFENGPKKNYVSASGKVMDENDLHAMIDASLDMWLTTGRFNDQFEAQLANYLGVRHALTTNSGSSANLLALSALTSHKLGDRRLKAGDEVITVAAGFPTTINPIIQNGMIPVFVDTEIGTYNINADMIHSALSDKTRAIMVAHTLGNPFDLNKVMEICKERNLWLIEDNCDSLGAKLNGRFTGSFGHIGTLSFYPAHHLTMGEGGALITNDSELYKIIMSVRDWGRDCWCPPGKDNTCRKRFGMQLGKLPFGYDHKYTYSHLGYNLKITDWQAALGVSQLAKLDGFIKKRRDNFSYLYNRMSHLDKYFILPHTVDRAESSWFGFVITLKDDVGFSKQDLVTYLENNGVGTRQLFAGNMLRQPAFTDNAVKLRINNSQEIMSTDLNEEHYAMLPNTDKIMNNTFWVGVWPGLTMEDLDKIVETIADFVHTKESK